ncbi:MAG: hypothetical protein ACK4N5_14095 [Myxococcales bacterium]
MNRSPLLLCVLLLAGCDPCKTASSRLCDKGEHALLCAALDTLVREGKEDASCKQLLEAAKSVNDGEKGATLAFAAASSAVLAAAAAAEVRMAAEKLEKKLASP